MSTAAQSDQLSTEHLLGIGDLTPGDIDLVFRTADGFKEVINRPIKKVPSLRDITIANLFFESSTRTRVSFELAERRLSADVVNFASSGSSVSKGETLVDTVNNILAMKVDMVVMRHPDPGAAVFLSRHVDARIVNAGDGTHEHPTQALLDAYSIREKLGRVKGVKVLIDAKAMMFLLGTEMDFQSTTLKSGFVFNNPNQVSACGCGESVQLKPAEG